MCDLTMSVYRSRLAPLPPPSLNTDQIRPISSPACIDISPHQWYHSLFDTSPSLRILRYSSLRTPICAPMVTPDSGISPCTVLRLEQTVTFHSCRVIYDYVVGFNTLYHVDARN
ncbi:hypothetical protein K439DRAFT_1624234 [Ramaria rubella]|nr:hypothetical protein K439DRAFT_1624234 [Ramaria rubella]